MSLQLPSGLEENGLKARDRKVQGQHEGFSMDINSMHHCCSGSQLSFQLVFWMLQQLIQACSEAANNFCTAAFKLSGLQHVPKDHWSGVGGKCPGAYIMTRSSAAFWGQLS